MLSPPSALRNKKSWVFTRPQQLLCFSVKWSSSRSQERSRLKLMETPVKWVFHTFTVIAITNFHLLLYLCRTLRRPKHHVPRLVSVDCKTAYLNELKVYHFTFFFHCGVTILSRSASQSAPASWTLSISCRNPLGLHPHYVTKVGKILRITSNMSRSIANQAMLYVFIYQVRKIQLLLIVLIFF